MSDSIRGLAIAVSLVAMSARAQPPPSAPSVERRAPSSEYRNIRFTAQHVDREDQRFRMAAEGTRLEGGVRLVSRDPALYSMAWINGFSAGLLRDGRAFAILRYFAWDNMVNEFRVAATMELAGSAPDRAGQINQAPAYSPDIPGYRFVISDSIGGTRHAVGLWRRIGGADETLLVAFHAASRDGPARHEILGRLPMRLNSIYLHGGLHIWYINVITEARVGRPIYILRYALPPDALPYGSRATRNGWPSQ